MRSTLVAATLLVAILLPSACATDAGTRPEADPTVIRVTFKSWKQTVDVDLMARTLARSHTEYTYSSPTSGTPSSASTISEPAVALDAAKVEEVRALVLGSGFLDLEKAYGAPEGERHYPYRIIVKFDGGDRKEVLFRSNPSHEEKPEAFAKLEAHLLALTGE
jgi:hypothetical protein